MTGSGTIGDPYIIENVTDLQNIENDLTAYYELGGDIDASATTGWNGGTGFLPISPELDPVFTGQLDGKDYTISDLFINRTLADYQALFGGIGTGAVIQNVKMTDVDITDTGNYVAALVGYMENGTVTDCSSKGTVDGNDYVGGLIGYMVAGTINGTDGKCWSSCVGTAGDDYAGGFVGYMQGGAISKCYAIGAVSGDDYIGSFVGWVNGGTIDDCYARGAITAGNFAVAGFVGANGFGASGGVITNCYSTGSVTGDFKAGFCYDNDETITNCFWDTETSGVATSDGGTGKTTAQMKAQSTFTDAGWDFSTIWYITSIVNDGYPAFTWIDIGHPSVSIQAFILG